jgi:hypothetical protein
MVDTRRKPTERGMGVVRAGRGKPSRVAPARPDPEDDARPLGVRDTVPAPPMVQAKESGPQRRFTREGFADRQSGSGALADTTSPIPTKPVSRPAAARPASAPPEGRYSSSLPVEEIEAPPTSGSNELRRSVRQPFRVDAVGETTIVATQEAALTSKPRLADRKRISDSPLSARDAFLLSLVDGALTVQDLIDAAGMPEPEVRAILARLTRLGIVSLTT